MPGDTEIVVIVPTADHDGIYARNIKEIFRGLHIIFVESRGPYFSYSYSCNAGFKYALKKYKPKWFILSNDDMIMEDPPDKIKQELSVINERNIATVFTNLPVFIIQFHHILFNSKSHMNYYIHYILAHHVNARFLIFIRNFT
ncbi:hypothetical protein [Vulcanisaeta sp. JCM 16161]|uniref:hypothetical protein n=1 Tax=Vulcanisaeta sp. JCM 16161 TaxID=1295372 RepID=UPI0006D254CF|nr:hypothetical protein [Vulcanisaeta sp. JCM 16161]